MLVGPHAHVNGAVQRDLDFPGTVYGVDRGTPMRDIMTRQSAYYGTHRDDTQL